MWENCGVSAGRPRNVRWDSVLLPALPAPQRRAWGSLRRSPRQPTAHRKPRLGVRGARLTRAAPAAILLFGSPGRLAWSCCRAPCATKILSIGFGVPWLAWSRYIIGLQAHFRPNPSNQPTHPKTYQDHTSSPQDLSRSKETSHHTRG